MGSPEVQYYRAIKSSHSVRKGDVYPGVVDCDGTVKITISGRSSWEFERDEKKDLWENFALATEADFNATVAAAEQAIRDLHVEQNALRQETLAFNTQLIGAGDQPAEGMPANTNTTLATVNPAGQIRNKAHSIKRRASELAVSVKEKTQLLEAKMEQRLAIAMAGLGDMQGLVKKLEEVVYTVQLYLGRNEEVSILRDGELAPAETPLCIRQNVLYMDEECALQESHGIDFEEISSFDAWLLAKPEHLQQVLPEPKGVVVLQVRRYKKKYEAENVAEMLANAAKAEENLKTYWLIRNGERLHRIWADIQVGERLLPNSNEVEHFFYERGWGSRSGEQIPLRPGSKAFIQAMDRADALRRHYMRLMLVLQGLIDRTQLFAPYKNETRPNLLDPMSTEGVVNFLRDVEGTITDGRPSFKEWLKSVNECLTHGYRVAGTVPTWFGKDDEKRIHPRNAEGVNDELVHTVIETGGKLYFLFKRTDEIYHRSTWRTSGGYETAKTPGRYTIYRDDDFIICIDSPEATIETMEYYLKDRRHRHEYESMVPCLKAAIALKQAEAKSEKPFRELLARKLEEAVPGTPISPEMLDQLVLWWKTKTKEHRALLKDDAKAYRMILERYVAQAGGKNVEADRKAFLEAVHRMPNAVYAYHAGGREFGVLLTIDGMATYVREETWRITKGTAHKVDEMPFVLPQKAHYHAFPTLFKTTSWDERPHAYSPAKHLNPAHYPALAKWVKENPWFGGHRSKHDKGERVVAIYITEERDHSQIRAASIEMNPTGGGWMSSGTPKRTRTSDIPQPDGHERVVEFTAGKNPKFSYSFDYGTRTHIDHQGIIQLGWAKKGEEHTTFKDRTVVVFVDDAVLDETAKTIAARNKHNAKSNSLRNWAYRAEKSANAAIEELWNQKQLSKYIAESGDPEFFEDHLKTLPKNIPEAGFISSVLVRALDAGKSVEELAKLNVEELLKQFRPLKKKHFSSDKDEEEKPDAEAVAQLKEAGWVPPPWNKKEDEEED